MRPITSGATVASSATPAHIRERSRAPLTAIPTPVPRASASSPPREYVSTIVSSNSSIEISAVSRPAREADLSTTPASAIGTAIASRSASAFQ